MTLLQAGDGARLKGFNAGPFDVKAGQNVHPVDLHVAPLKDSMLLAQIRYGGVPEAGVVGGGCC